MRSFPKNKSAILSVAVLLGAVSAHAGTAEQKAGQSAGQKSEQKAGQSAGQKSEQKAGQKAGQKSA